MNNILSIKLYSKPSTKHKILLCKSTHQKKLLKLLPYSSGLRIIRSCFDVKIRNLEPIKFYKKFKERNYPRHILTYSFGKLKLLDRESVLNQQKTVNF